MRAQLEVERQALEYAPAAVREAAAQVLAASPAVAAAVERLKRAQAELVDAGDEVLWLGRHNVLFIDRAPPVGVDIDEALRARARSAKIRLESNPIGWHELIRQRLPSAAVREWDHALEQLQSDPDAPVPMAAAAVPEEPRPPDHNAASPVGSVTEPKSRPPRVKPRRRLRKSPAPASKVNSSLPRRPPP